ncbi:MAG: Trm112 family protein [Thermoplasmata archaeon]|nr:Trm112 family protein [Thermoplasmata archaeon]
MRRDLLPLLACPDCRGGLVMEGADEAAVVQSGTLKCTACGNVFPIEEGIPRLLPKGKIEGRSR